MRAALKQWWQDTDLSKAKLDIVSAGMELFVAVLLCYGNALDKALLGKPLIWLTDACQTCR